MGLVLALGVLGLALSDPLHWVDPKTSAEFDWSSLQRSDPWVVVSNLNDEFFTTVYSFNFGSNLERSCNPSPVAAVMQVEILGNMFEKCSVLGRHEMSHFSLLSPSNPDSGLLLTYQGGDICSDLMEDQPNEPRQVSFRLRCKPVEEGRFRLVDEEGKPEYETCNLVFEMYTPAGCPVAYPSIRKSTLKWLILLVGGGLLSYFIAALLWSWKKNTGQVPFEGVLSLAWDGCRFAFAVLVAPLQRKRAAERYSEV